MRIDCGRGTYVRSIARDLGEALDVQRLGEREARSAAAPPERLERTGRLALEPALQRLNPRRGDMAAEAVEALDADQCLEAAAPPFEQPKQPERMADRDGVLGPVGRALGPARDEAEIDERDFGAIEMRDEIRPDAGVKAPPMDKHEMHGLREDRPSQRAGQPSL